MSKNKLADEIINEVLEKKPIKIIAASLKDDFCNYSYEITNGVGLGDTHTVKGSGIIEEDMRSAFAALIVHLAIIDDVFKHAGVEFETINEVKSHELAFLYHVTGIKIKGSEENESVVIIGNKYVSAAGGRIEMETPRIPIDSLSSYKWWNELKEAVEAVRSEVELYKGGKYTAVKQDEEEIKPDPKQTKMTFLPAEEEESFDDFENAKV